MVGLRFGRIIVVSEVEPTTDPDGRKCRRFLIRCDCGGEKIVTRQNLRSGDTQSCGCLFEEHNRRRKWSTHGESQTGRTAEYRAWTSMKSRCINERHSKFQDYGGRGISVCQQWTNSYERFLADMGRKPTPAHSIDRIDNDGNYEPGNCRWATAKQQVDNRREPKPRSKS
jgi:hypothetical protein